MTDARRDLENVQIPEPCNADWAAMLGDERRRYCDQCELHVHNVAAMPRDEAEALIARRDEGEKVCVRLEYEADGSCVTADEPEPPSPQRRTALALALGTSLLAACRSDEPRPPGDSQTLENTAVESAEPARIGQAHVLQGGIAAPVDEEAGAGLEQCEPQGGIRMGRISLEGTVTVNSDGQLTDTHDQDGATTPEDEPLLPTMGEVAPLADEPDSACEADADGEQAPFTMGGVGDSVPAPPPAVMGKPGPSGPTPPSAAGGDAAPASSGETESELRAKLGASLRAPEKRRVMLGSPGPRSSTLPAASNPVPKKR